MAVEQQIKEYDNQASNEPSLMNVLDRAEKAGAGKAKLEFSMFNYLDRKARLRGVPIKGTFELTPLCNLDCKMCFVHLSVEQLQYSSKRMLMGEQWKQIMQDAIERGMMYALLTGGEAMLHPDFNELYLFLREKGVQVTVNTNGLLLTQERIEFFRNHPPAEVRITLYGADEETYENVTGHRVHGLVMRNIQAAKAAGLHVCVGVTPSKYMKGGVEATVRMVRSLGVRYGINTSLSDPREETGRSGIEHDMSMDDYIQMHKQLQAMDGTVVVPVCEEDIPVPGGNVKEPQKGFRCGGGRSAFAVVWHGKMQPCLTVGNIQADLNEMPFDTAWRQVFGAVSAYPVPQECFGCPYEGFCTVCVARHATGAPLGHANPALCERAKAFVRSGLAKLRQQTEFGSTKNEKEIFDTQC